MFRGRKLWLTLLLVIAVGGIAAYLTFDGALAPAPETASDETLQTSIVRRGNIIVSATGAGTVIAAREVSLSFASSGVLTALPVEVGDRVAAGDVLARIDDSEAQKGVANARLQLAQAAMQSDATATEAGISYDDISVEQARINLEVVQADLDALQNWQPDADEIALLSANLQAAQSSYYAAASKDSASQNSVTTAEISLRQAQDALASAQEAYDNAFDPARDWERNIDNTRDAAAASLQRAKDNLVIEQANYDSAVKNVSYASSNSASAGVLSAEQALAVAQTPPSADEMWAAEIAVRQAELALQQALLGQEADALSFAQARLSLETAEATLANTELTAPMAGTVMAVYGAVGENAGSNVIVLADLEQTLLEVFLDETDLDKVGVGYEADVVFDALPDETFSGSVVRVDPQLTVESGITAVRAVVAVSIDKPQQLPVGLNATVDVIGGRAENALIVPVEAVREISPGQYGIFVMENGEPQLRMVDVGLMDFTFAEILSGVAEGDVVTTGIVATGE